MTKRSSNQETDIARQIGTSVGRVDGALGRYADDDVFLRTVTIRAPEEGQGDYFVVSRWWVGGEQKVAFHSAGTFWEAVKGLADRMQNGSLTFKDDQYAK